MGLLTIQDIADMMDGEIIDGDPCITINNYSYDSREGDSQTLFLPVVGENKDAHDYISGALATGMIATTTERNRVEENTEGMTYIAIDNTQNAIQRLGARYRNCFNVKCVGITGSVGKTSTKEMVSAALEPDREVLKTEGNKNGQLGVPLMVLRLEESTELMVLEMGVSLPGEMERLAKIAKPDLALVTNIGYSHVGNYGSRELIRKEKLNIISEMDEDGILLLNGENELLAELAPGSPLQKDISEIELYPAAAEKMGIIRRFSYGISSWCDFRAENIQSFKDGTQFDFVCRDFMKRYAENAPEEISVSEDEIRISVSLSVYGEHNVMNAISAMAAAYLMDCDLVLAAKGLSQYSPMAMRGKIETLENGICLIDDSYNASPDSMKSGLKLLDMTESMGRKLAILGDMFELGEESEKCHRKVGEYAAHSSADIIMAVGKDAAFIAEEAEKILSEIGINKIVCHFDSKSDCEEELAKTVKEGDLVLCKGSRGMHLDETAKMLRELKKN